MADSLGSTLSIADDRSRQRGGPSPRPVLTLALECSRPQASSARYDLSGLTAVIVGRGHNRSAERVGDELFVRVPDRWMSSRHARFEPSFGRWLVTKMVQTSAKAATGRIQR